MKQSLSRPGIQEKKEVPQQAWGQVVKGNCHGNAVRRGSCCSWWAGSSRRFVSGEENGRGYSTNHSYLFSSNLAVSSTLRFI